jgi:hypothetical protein
MAAAIGRRQTPRFRVDNEASKSEKISLQIALIGLKSSGGQPGSRYPSRTTPCDGANLDFAHLNLFDS